MSAPYLFQLTGGTRDPRMMREAAERAKLRTRRRVGVALGLGPRPCECCAQTFQPAATNQVDCASCSESIPYRLRRLGRKVAQWSAARSLRRSLAGGATPKVRR